MDTRMSASDRAAQILRAVELAERLDSDSDHVVISMTSSGVSYVTVRSATAIRAIPGHAVTEWYGGENDGRWQRTVSVRIDRVVATAYEYAHQDDRPADVEHRSPAGEQAGGALAASAVVLEATAGAPCASGAPEADDAPTCDRCDGTGTLPECGRCEGCLCLGEGGRFGGRASGCGGPCDCGAAMDERGGQ